MIIDFHTHIFPDKIAARAVKVLEENLAKVQGTPEYAVIPATLDALRESMRSNHIDISVVLPIATTLTQSTSINNFAASINGTDGIISFGSLHPMQENWEQTLYDIKEKGLPGIKLHPEYQQFYIDSPESVRILKKCEELGLLVTLHAGKDVGYDPPVHCMPERLRRVLDIVSGENIIAAHLGGWAVWDDVEKYLVGTPVYFDTAYTISDISREQLLRIFENHGYDKILFATDSPWEAQGDTVRYLSELGIGESNLNKIFSENAKKLLKL
ncbi:MAG: amidohydrolase family protein [Oscillospiraceae bacterium]|nr:amidohydrolase family protein [Oscillospiraceae bacterium]